MPTPFRPRDVKVDARRDVDAELRYHLDMRAAEFEAQGMPPDEARRAAAASFGDLRAVEEECVDIREERERVRRRATVRWNLAMDTRFALRTLRRSPLFTAAAVLTLALGIGGAAAVFTLVNGVLLRPLPYADPSRIVMVWTSGQGMRGAETQWPLSAPNYLDIRAQTRTLASIAAFRAWPYTLAGDAGTAPEMLGGARVDPALFPTLGVRPLLGRGFTPEEGRAGAQHVAVLGYDVWRRRFGGDPGVVGRTVTLSGEQYLVVGVMPRGFAFPRGAELPAGFQFSPHTELWTPLVFSPQDLEQRGTENLAAVARLRRSASIEAARADLARTAGWLARQYPRVFTQMGLGAISIADQAAQPVRRGLLLLMAAVGFVLLIACANVANLLVARAARRAREFATRGALGATRGRVFLQLVVENAVLALVGGAVGLGAAAWGASVLLRHLPTDLPRADDVVVDLRVVGATLAAALLAGIAFAAATALHAARGSLAAGVAGTRTTSGRRERAGRRLLVGAEVALSLVLLVCAGLLTRSFVRLQRTEPGFDARGAMAAGLLAPLGGSFDPQRDGAAWTSLFTRYLARLGAQADILAAGGVSSLPLTGAEESTGLMIDEKRMPPGEQMPSADYNVIAGDYFAAMRIPLIAGRVFDARDAANAPSAVIVSETLARRYFPGVPIAAVLGHHLGVGFGGPEPHVIVGVVGDVRQSALDAAATPAIYLPQAQMPYPFLSIVARARNGDAAAALPRMRQALAEVDPTVALHDERPLARVVATSIGRQRFVLAVTGAFAAAALVLSAVGLYAVIATSVSQRTRELGVRLALGARPADVRALVLREGLRVTALGLVVGLAGAYAAARLLRGQLYEVSVGDPMVYTVVAVLTALIALGATWVPARRATEVDPVLAIRAE